MAETDTYEGGYMEVGENYSEDNMEMMDLAVTFFALSSLALPLRSHSLTTLPSTAFHLPKGHH